MSTEWLLALGGCLTGVAGIIAAWAALKRAKVEKDEECLEKLMEARRDADHYYTELREHR